MTFPFAKTFVAVLALAAVTLTALPAQAELSRKEVESIVKEYIESNPQLILDSVQNHQERAMREERAGAVRDNHDRIYKDDLTPVAGNPEGDVTLVEFFDYNCGYCKKVLPQIMQLIEEDKNVRILFKDFPILGPTSEDASRWALAAHQQGKYFEYHRALMENNKPVTDALLAEIGKKVGLDVEKAKSAAAGPAITAQIQRNRLLASEMDIRGTPAFLVGDNLAPGAVSLSKLKEMIAEERAGKGKD